MRLLTTVGSFWNSQYGKVWVSDLNPHSLHRKKDMPNIKKISLAFQICLYLRQFQIVVKFPFKQKENVCIEVINF